MDGLQYAIPYSLELFMNDFYQENNLIYADSIRLYPNDHRGVNWSSLESQFTRFKILCEISDDLFSSQLLDVGCGMGHLVDYLLQNQFSGTYKGIDVFNAMISLAKKRHPHFNFECNDIHGVEKNAYDYVLASGIFAFVNAENTQHIISDLFLRAAKGLTFNCLSMLSKNKVPGVYYHHPEMLFAFCKTLTPNVILRENYLSNDFTLYLLR